ncbi:MAG: hypothetical protein LBS23_02490 [Holosporaceae bacterium]|jgi:MtN3 and saliva related transmembrane protein|nr:hypothetical protein [Holosporaceae bacterium]
MFESLKCFIEFMFGFGLFFNAILFVPQAMRIYKAKSSRGISLTTFVGFNFMQILTILHGYISGDYILMLGTVFSLVCCGAVTFLIIFYKRK